MSLRERQEARRQQGSSDLGGGGSERQHLDFVADETYNPPLVGIYRQTGRFVKVRARGNTKGMSATWQITDEQGLPQIVSLQQIVMVDFSQIPPTVEQVEQILNNLKYQE